MLTLEAAAYRHAGASADSLRDVSLALADATLTGLVGASGSGVSTLCLVLGGLAPRVVGGELQGRLRIDAEDTAAWPMHRFPEHVVVGLGRPAAQLSLVAETVLEEVAFGPANLGLPRSEVLAHAQAALDDLAIGGLAARDPRQLSGGEQQLVVLAGLLAMGTRHLVLDGPLAHLDPVTRVSLLDVLARQAAEGKAILMAEHRRGALDGRFASILRLDEGRLGGEFGGADIALEPPAAALAPWALPPSPMTGSAMEAPGIVLEGVAHTYASGVMALDGIDLVVHPGEVVAIVGANGSGKTTLARHLDGLLRPTRGRVRLDGQDIAGRSVAELARSVALGFQDPDRQIFGRSVAAEVGFGPRQLGRAPAAAAAAVDRALAAVGLQDHAHVHPADLGTRHRKLLAIASLLAMECPVLVLDEPTAGLDDAGVLVVERIVAAQRAAARTVIVISHDEPFVARSCGRVVRLEGGRIVADGSPAAVLGAAP